jgi:FtsZ-interacting cell division protein ZipA
MGYLVLILVGAIAVVALSFVVTRRAAGSALKQDRKPS